MKVLLLSGIPPCTNLTAGQVLEKLCRFFPSDSLACFSVVPPWLDVRVPDDLKSLPMRKAARPHEKAYRVLPGALGSVTAFLRESYHRQVSTSRLIQEAIEYGRAWGAEAVWCVLEGQTMIRMAVPVAKGLGVPLYTQVWDPPQWWLRHNNIDPITTAAVLRDFDTAVKYSHACATASWAMAEEYEKKYGVRSIALLPPLDSAVAMAPAANPHSGEDFVIGLAGQLYADQEWNALLSALHDVNWVVAGKNVRIHLLGRYANLRSDMPANIRYLGWASQTESIRLMSECDLLYCPYWFDSAFEREARLSFPAKLTTYLAAGRPVLFHGPEYASPGRFLARNKAGLLCGALEKPAILQALTQIATDADLYGTLTANGSKAFHENLTLDAMRQAFMRFLPLERVQV